MKHGKVLLAILVFSLVALTASLYPTANANSADNTVDRAPIQVADGGQPPVMTPDGVGTWTPLVRRPPSAIQLLLLLSDGTVMAKGVSGGDGNAWYRLTPDIHGSYVNGTWTTLSPMQDTRLYFSSQVLADGRVFIAGGEYPRDPDNGIIGRATAEIFDPVANSWTRIDPPTSLLDPSMLSPIFASDFQAFADSVSEILPNGRVLVAPVAPNVRGGTLEYDPATNVWSAGPILANNVAFQDEASWVKLPDRSILTIDPFGQNSERFIPSTNTWIPDSDVPVELYDPFGSELGAAFLLPNGKAFFLGSTGHTAIYTPSGTTNPGTWAAGSDIPNSQGTPDAAAAMMVNGRILCAVSPLPTSGNHFPPPTSFYEYDYVANSFTQVSAPTGSIDDISSYVTLMLDLPDGTVLYSHFGDQLYDYAPTGAPLNSGKPTIFGIQPNGDSSYHLTGTLLNGISEGAAYGDDNQMASNYPLVRLTATNGNVYYARTYNWSSTGVMTGNTQVSTEFRLPAGLPSGTYSLVAVANGIASNPVSFNPGGSPSPTPPATPTATPFVTPTPVPTVTPCGGGANVVADGGFESGGIPSTIWNNPQSSTNFGTPLCDFATCGNGGGASPPRTGSIWVWFGGIAAPETATLGQNVIIPSGGSAVLNFWMRVGTVSSPFTDVLNVRVDGAIMQSYSEPSVAESDYTLRTINLNAFANGAVHNIEFEYIGPSTGTGSYVVDDVSLIAGSGCATPSPSPSATVGATPTPCGGTVFSQNFDGVTAPALPAGWVATNPVSGDGILWVTSATASDTAPNNAFIPDQTSISDKVVDTPGITISSASAQLSFRNNFDTEFSDGTYWDGGVLEVSSSNINGGAFTDVTDPAVGGSFISGGYTGLIDNTANNPLAGRMAWSGSSFGYINTVVNLGPNVNGRTIKLRFRLATDEAVGAPGWHIDNVSITGGGGCPSPTPAATATPTATPCGGTVFSESFDGVTSPALPSGWVATNPVFGDGIFWVTSTTNPYTSPNAAFIPDQTAISDKVLDTPGIAISSASAQLSFRNNFDTEFSDGTYWDGGVLEVSSPNINGGAFTDVTDPAVGGNFVSGGYTGVIDNTANNPLAGRMAWSGSSFGYINTVVNLGPNVNGRTIKLRFRLATDEAVGAPGWHIDTLSVINGCGTPTILGNISTRLRVETGNNVLIGGFIVTGTQPKKVIVRAIGPSLASLFTGVLADPVLELHGPAGFTTITNDNWRSTQQAEIIATGIPPTNDLESAIVATLPANNAAYTAIVRGVNNGTGIGVVEAYDLDRTVDSKLANISTRGLVQTGNNVMIGGLIVLGQAPLRVLVRAIGPSLPVAGVLGDPTLELRDGNGALIAANDNWRSDQEAEIIATTIPPSNDLESAIVRNLTPGNYTAIVRGVSNTTGVALVEAYGLN